MTAHERGSTPRNDYIANKTTLRYSGVLVFVYKNIIYRTLPAYLSYNWLSFLCLFSWITEFLRANEGSQSTERRQKHNSWCALHTLQYSWNLPWHFICLSVSTVIANMTGRVFRKPSLTDFFLLMPERETTKP